jgi:hypothetical protein
MVPPLEHAWGVHRLPKALTHSTQKGLPTIIKLDAMTARRGSPDEFMKFCFPSQFLGRVTQLVWGVVRVIIFFITNIWHFGIFIFLEKGLSFFFLFGRSWWRTPLIALLFFLSDRLFLYLSRR